MTRVLLRWGAVAASVVGAAAAQAQSGDPDRIDRQLALGHAAAIENAFRSVEQRIRVTDVTDLWEDEWDGVSDPPVSGWWLRPWTARDLTARYCDGVLAVYADQDELKGVGRDHRAVQVAPVAYGNARSGLQLVTQGTRVYSGAHGRSDGLLPGCMPVPSTTGDRVALVSEVADPKETAVGLRWETEDRTVSCAAPDTGTMVERRRIPIQVTAVDNCPAATPNCNDLREFVAVPGAWPADCATRETMLSATPPELPANAACSDWARWRSNCQIVYAAAPPAADIPDPVITWEPAPVVTWTRSCSCPAGETGTCTEYWAQNTEWRVFVLRPGVPEVRTRWPARVNGGRRLVARIEDCEPPPSPDDPDHGGPDGDGDGATTTSTDAETMDTVDHTGAPEDPDVGNSGGGGGSCFLTTAVVEMRGEEDDGPTLTAMRRFRDTYMQATPERREMVEGYYRVAPAIVAAIPKDHPDWAWLEGEIDTSAAAFRRGENDLAFEIMTGAVHRLHDRWLVEVAGEQQDG